MSFKLIADVEIKSYRSNFFKSLLRIREVKR